jgi:hypothetical protein
MTGVSDQEVLDRRNMLGFAIIDRQPSATTTAVWLTTRLGPTLVRNTNAVVIHDDDPDYDEQMWSLTADRSVVFTKNSETTLDFEYGNPVDVFDDLIEQTAAQQERIRAAVEDYATRKQAKLVSPKFLPAPVLLPPRENDARYRALAVADFVGQVWTAWLYTEDQRHHRTVAPKTGATPWIMPEELNSPTLAVFPPGFADRMQPEPLTRRGEFRIRT